MHIRAACAGDLPALCALLTELFSIEADFRPDPERQRRALALLLEAGDAACVLVAERAGEVVGMSSVQRLISTAEGGPVGLVEDVVVRADVRGRGVGRALLDALEAWARTQGFTRLQLLADRNNAPALDFYRRLGWESTQLTALRRML